MLLIETRNLFRTTSEVMIASGAKHGLSTALFLISLLGPFSQWSASAQNLPAKIAPATVQRMQEAIQTMPSPIPASPSVGDSKGGQAAPPRVETITAVQTKSLRQEFMRAQISQLRAEKHRQGLEMKELAQAQKSKRKDFESREALDRKAFFERNKNGPERRQYVKEMMDRRKSFHQDLSKEMTEKKQSHQIQLQSLQKTQAEKRDRFEESLKRAEKPAAELWP